MSAQEKDFPIIDILAQHEEVIGRLYQVYADRFPEHKTFWSKLAQEEQQHADMLRKLYARIQAGEGTVREDAFDMTCVHSSLSRMQTLLKEALYPDLTFQHALSTANTIEKSILENKYFEIFTDTSPEIQHIKNFLAQATEDHRKRIEEMLIK